MKIVVDVNFSGEAYVPGNQTQRSVVSCSCTHV